MNTFLLSSLKILLICYFKFGPLGQICAKMPVIFSDGFEETLYLCSPRTVFFNAAVDAVVGNAGLKVPETHFTYLLFQLSVLVFLLVSKLPPTHCPPLSHQF